MSALKQYGEYIKSKDYTPKQAAQSFVMDEIKGWVEEFKDQLDNASEKRFVVALAKLHNEISDSFNKSGDSTPIEVDEIKSTKVGR